MATDGDSEGGAQKEEEEKEEEGWTGRTAQRQAVKGTQRHRRVTHTRSALSTAEQRRGVEVGAAVLEGRTAATGERAKGRSWHGGGAKTTQAEHSGDNTNTQGN